MVGGGWVLLVLTLAAPARAERLEGGWTDDLDLSAGFGGRLRLGAGPRLLG